MTLTEEAKYRQEIGHLWSRVKVYEDQLIEAQKREDKLREVLELLARLGGIGGEYGNSEGNMIARQALLTDTPGEVSPSLSETLANLRALISDEGMILDTPDEYVTIRREDLDTVIAEKVENPWEWSAAINRLKAARQSTPAKCPAQDQTVQPAMRDASEMGK